MRYSARAPSAAIGDVAHGDELLEVLPALLVLGDEDDGDAACSGSFDEVDPPNLTVTEANPAHRLDYQRFASDEVVAFNRAQAEILRPLSPGRDIVHNFMGFFTAFDHHAVGRDLDVAAWDSYPLGFLDQGWDDADTRRRFLRQGHPDFAAFHHDLYRGCARGRMWVLEMPGFMSQAGGANSRDPINNVVVLEDQNDDGVMDKRTVFADGLVLARSVKVLDRGVLVEPNVTMCEKLRRVRPHDTVLEAGIGIGATGSDRSRAHRGSGRRTSRGRRGSSPRR